MNTTPDLAELIEQLQCYGVGEWAATEGLKQDFRCPYCDADLLASYDSYRFWVCDHIIPISRGGNGALENIVNCCGTCNLIKGFYMPVGSTRFERLADARQYVQQKRAKQEEKMSAIRALVRPNAPDPK